MNDSLPYHPFSIGLENSNISRELKYVIQDNQFLAYITGLVYVILIFSLKAQMKNRKPLKLMVFSILWNFSLFVVNSMGFFQSVMHMVFVLRNDGFYRGVCNDDAFQKDPVLFFWTVVFPFLKIVELGDTFLIVLQKRFLATFYWAHHLFALIVTWYIFPYFTTAGEWLGLLIYFNHVPVYFLATIKSFGVKLPRMYSTGLMISEVAHMVSGISLCSAIYYFMFTNQYCDISLLNNSIIMATYVVCFILCTYLLYHRFLKSHENGQTKKTSVNNVDNVTGEKNPPEDPTMQV